jgi:hypothetical protein
MNGFVERAEHRVSSAAALEAAYTASALSHALHLHLLLPATIQSARSDACVTTAKGNEMQGAGVIYSERSLAMINT